mmetsp:Transcript_94618/g.306064  ORF Transcript_94618/g.306064 Transcript_94618/m.306064 type:complete len:278 (-) Transcript_94618:494-1327(-)
MGARDAQMERLLRRDIAPGSVCVRLRASDESAQPEATASSLLSQREEWTWTVCTRPGGRCIDPPHGERQHQHRRLIGVFAGPGNAAALASGDAQAGCLGARNGCIALGGVAVQGIFIPSPRLTVPTRTQQAQGQFRDDRGWLPNRRRVHGPVHGDLGGLVGAGLRVQGVLQAAAHTHRCHSLAAEWPRAEAPRQSEVFLHVGGKQRTHQPTRQRRPRRSGRLRPAERALHSDRDVGIVRPWDRPVASLVPRACIRCQEHRRPVTSSDRPPRWFVGLA